MDLLGILSHLELPSEQMNALRDLAKSPLSIDNVYKTLQSQGIQIPRSIVRSAVPAIRTINTLTKSYNSQNYSTRPNAGLTLKSIGEQRSRYSYPITFTVTNKNTGETSEITRNLASDFLMSKQGAVDTWLEHFSSNNSTSEFTIVDYTVGIPTEDYNYRSTP